jgi:hypothetical protein
MVYTLSQLTILHEKLKRRVSALSASIDSSSAIGASITDNKFTVLGATSSNNPTMVEFRRMYNEVEIGRGQVGILGGPEFNTTLNMDYTDNTHKYFDNSKDAIWTYLQNQTESGAGWGIQWVKRGHTNDDTMWTTWGKVVYSITIIPNGSGEAVTGGSRVKLQEVEFIDGNYTSSNVTVALDSEQINWTNLTQMNLPPTTFAKGGSLYSDPTAIATYKTTGANTYLVFANEDNSNAFTHYRFLKNKASSYNIGSGTKVCEFDFNGGINYSGVRGTSQTIAAGAFSLLEYYWQTTNAAGATADRMILTDEGYLRLLKVDNYADDAAASAGGVPVGGIYRTASALKIRVS